ncbi:hypothetical protein BaRGS_00021153, partial [Batillaria attramentaria]
PGWRGLTLNAKQTAFFMGRLNGYSLLDHNRKRSLLRPDKVRRSWGMVGDGTKSDQTTKCFQLSNIKPILNERSVTYNHTARYAGDRHDWRWHVMLGKGMGMVPKAARRPRSVFCCQTLNQSPVVDLEEQA